MKRYTTTRCITKRSTFGNQYIFDKHIVITGNHKKAMAKFSHLEDLEEKITTIYGDHDGLLDVVVNGLIDYENKPNSKVNKSRLLTDEDVDKWDALKERALVKPLKQNNTCPVCKKELDTTLHYMFCPYCGQKIR